ncbi:MAG: capsular biosynthesis protein, partial [Planctomycetota bacterium]
MIAEQTTDSQRKTQLPNASHFHIPQALDVVGALWRYKWAVLLPAIAGSVIGFLVYINTEDTYRSTVRLMVESNRPPIFDAMTGEVHGGVADIEVLKAELFSDDVATSAFNNVNMQPFRELYDDRLEQFTIDVIDQMELEPEVTDIQAAQAMVTLLHFDSPNAEHCEAAIKSYVKAIQGYYQDKYQNSQGELGDIIENAIKQVSPQLSQLEKEYADFRVNAELNWDEEGNAINPHRERQQYLSDLQAQYTQELRRDESTLVAMKKAAENAPDPRITLSVMSQLLEVKLSAVSGKRPPDPLAGDNILAVIDLDKQLVPLVVEKTKNVAQYGPSHPTVKAVEQELEATRDELIRLVTDQADRIRKLREEWYADQGDPVQQAADKVEAILASYEARIGMLQGHIKELDQQIGTEKVEAAKLAGAEYENLQRLREIEQYRAMLQQLEENMQKVDLTKEEEFTTIKELSRPTQAYLIGPSILKMGGIGTLVGLLLGGGLALLLEKNANTFRDPQEISGSLGIPILTHIPFFRGKRRKLKKGEIDPYKSLSTGLAVVHQPSSMTAEAIRSLRTAVFFDTSGIAGGKVLQITSPLPGDGKSTILQLIKQTPRSHMHLHT